MRMGHTERLPKALTPSLISLAIASLFAPVLTAPAFALPTGAQVAAGQATLTRPNANTLNIQNTPGAIINWQQFNIGAGESVRIQQQNAASAILNRVVGGEASKILGQLSSNGRVFLINPSGIVFGQGARIDTAGFIASTLNISDANFLAGKFSFEGSHKNGIKNEGAIKSLGEIILIAPKIENSGILQTEGGDIILAAGQKVTITNLANPEVQVEIRAPDNEIVNLGRILSNGGAIAMFASRLRHSGEINATRAEAGPGGRITLRGEDELVVTPEAKIVSDGTPAGQITLESPNGTVTVEGLVSARGVSPATPKSESGAAQARGGRIEVLGQQVVVAATAVIDASGEQGGGAIYLGGDYQGGGVPLPDRWAANPATLAAQPVTSISYAPGIDATASAEALIRSSPPGAQTELTEMPAGAPANQSGAGSYARQPLIPPATRCRMRGRRPSPPARASVPTPPAKAMVAPSSSGPSSRRAFTAACPHAAGYSVATAASLKPPAAGISTSAPSRRISARARGSPVSGCSTRTTSRSRQAEATPTSAAAPTSSAPPTARSSPSRRSRPHSMPAPASPYRPVPAALSWATSTSTTPSRRPVPPT